jgi:8-oxo-dGTP pyrophosphatase MutT (NUDIX family)
MAFPGGLLDATDRNGLDAARRETAEEIGLDMAPDCCIGRLSELTVPLLPGRRGLVITPYLFRLAGEVTLQANTEVAEIVWVPLAFLQDPANREKLVWGKRGIGIPMPSYRYQGRPIWGLSLRMLRELISLL